MNVTIVSFGFLHDDPPEAHLTADLRYHFKDPHVSPELKNLTARDAAVRDAVLGTPGIPALVRSLARAVSAFTDGPAGDKPFVLAIGCAGGRHRAATVAEAVRDALRDRLIPADVVHRDLSKPVVHR
jgi:UPF0042 nucleotide-binding protein